MSKVVTTRRAPLGAPSPAVWEFALLMQQRLDENAAKGDAYAEIDDERMISHMLHLVADAQLDHRGTKKLADIANYAMFVALNRMRRRSVG